MICIKSENNVVVDSAIFDSCPSGWIEQPTGVGIGWTDNGDGTYSAPVKPAPTAEEVAAEARGKRDRLIVEAGYMINTLEDTGGDATALRAYRQALRDVPLQAGFPDSITWPVVP